MDSVNLIKNEINSRLENIKIYYPFYNIFIHSSGRGDFKYEIPTLAIALLSFLLYEGELKGKEIVYNDIKTFVISFVEEVYGGPIEMEEAKALIRHLIGRIDKPFLFKTYDVVDRKDKEHIIKLVELEQNSTKTGFRYVITKEGIDFILKTKEFPEETKITLNLMLFRKQVELGSFNHALDSINRLNLEVKKKLYEKKDILNMMANRGKEGLKHYKDYSTSVLSQLEKEQELFDEARTTVLSSRTNYVEKIENDDLTRKDEDSFNTLNRIDKELGMANTLHSELLKDIVAMPEEYNKILELRRKMAFSEKFNFEKELDGIVKNNRHPDSLLSIINPLLNPSVNKGFCLLNIFQPQAIKKETDEMEVNEIVKEVIHVERIDDIVSERVWNNYTAYMKVFLNLAREKQMFDIKNLLKESSHIVDLEKLNHPDFVTFLINLNKSSEVNSNKKIIDFHKLNQKEYKELTTAEKVFINVQKSHKVFHKIKEVSVDSVLDDEIQLNEFIKVSNLTFNIGYES